MYGQLPQPPPIDGDDGENRPGLDGDGEQLRAWTQPVLGNQQMPGAGDRQEFGDALDDAEQDDLKQIVHAPPSGVRQSKVAMIARPPGSGGAPWSSGLGL